MFRSPHARVFARAIALALTLTALSAPAFAHRAPVRSNEANAIRALGTPDREFESYSAVTWTDGVQRQYGLDSGVLRRLWLRDPKLQPASADSPRSIAEGFVSAHATELGLDGAPAQVLALAYEKASPSGTHFRWNQVVSGVPVYRSEIVVKVNRKGQVSSVQNNLRPNVKLDVTPALDKDAALNVAKNVVKPTGKALADAQAQLVVVDSRTGARLAWIVDMPVEEPMGDWRVFVDAKSGAVLGAEDRMTNVDGSGRVFDPDPRSKMGDSTYVDNADADSAVPFPGSYDIRVLPQITLGAGVYSLSGPYVQLIDDESPTQAPVTATHPDSFRFQRSAQGFEDVMCYYHLDHSQRYIQSLGFTNVNNRVQPVDSHGLSGADNSHYVPSTGHLAFGEGGIDDDEDADVIWHEYGHSIQDNIVPGWGGSQEGAMGEGFGDYWAVSYSLSLFPGFQPNHVFTWDGNGETWTGRKAIDTSMHYPANCCGEVHASGTLWCSGLVDCWWNIGRAAMDAIVLDHHFALGTSATMADAANQLIQSDIDLFGGAHVSALVARLGFWGFVDPASFIPTITHTPLAGSENVTGPYAVVANVTSTQPLAAGEPKLFYGYGAITDSVSMTPTGNPNEYSANIPGPGAAATVHYYLRARDTNGGTAFKPTTAPASPYTFAVGPDLTAPVVTHTPPTVVAQQSWPITVTANVTDNLGVDHNSVTVVWTKNGTPMSDFKLARIGTSSNYADVFNTPNGSVVPGDVIAYHITATDVAISPNTGRSPAVGEHSFTISSALGLVLVLDDDELAKRVPETKVVNDSKDPAKATTVTSKGDVGALSANQIATWLNAYGYVATVEAAGVSNPATWPNYSFIVSSSGGSTSPVANATYRADLEAYVAAGHKLLVEGGEVGYDAISSPGYATFAANVLHGTTWQSDNAGALTQIASQASHPLANIPNVLPASIPITYVSPNYGTEDAYVPVSPAYAVYGTASYPTSVGISVFDNNVAPQSAQIVVFAFDIKDVTDSTYAKKLLENAAHFLTAPEPSPNSTITGRVAVGTAWGGAGIAVTLTPGGATVNTDSHGEFTFPNLYAGTYSVSASLAGYTGTPRLVTVAQSATSNVVLHLSVAANANNCNNPALAIPDNNLTGITNSMTIAPNFPIASVQVGVNITHTWRGDLSVDVIHGATTVRLHNHTGSSADNIIGTYPTTLTPAASLSAFNGQSSAGTWSLTVIDNASSDTGTLNQWCLTLAGASDTSATVGVDPRDLPIAFEFAPVWPNPVRGGNATLSFALPQAAHARVALYDVSGRLVRTVADRDYAAGRYVLAFDGHGDDGRAIAPGVYMARFQSEGRTVSRRFVILP
ncbi:MAG: proprotein convertase P-domain-containing protein [Candidatus Eisenbacteria bacterium]